MLTAPEVIELRAGLQGQTPYERPREPGTSGVNGLRVPHIVDEGLTMLENPAETWEIIKAIEPRVEFQRHLFPKGLEWDGENCRTPK